MQAGGLFKNNLLIGSTFHKFTYVIGILQKNYQIQTGKLLKNKLNSTKHHFFKLEALHR